MHLLLWLHMRGISDLFIYTHKHVEHIRTISSLCHLICFVRARFNEINESVFAAMNPLYVIDDGTMWSLCLVCRRFNHFNLKSMKWMSHFVVGSPMHIHIHTRESTGPRRNECLVRL